MIATAVPYSISVLITFLFCIIEKREFGKNIATALCCMSGIMYLSQYLLGTFTPGLYILYGMAALSIPLFFLLNGGASKNREYILTGGLWAYIGCLLVVTVMDAGRSFYSWDEFMHWGKMVKEMIRLDRFYCVTESTLYRHKDYPPFVALFEYAWCRMGGGYSEQHVAQALHLLNVSLIVPYMFEQFPVRTKWKDGPEYIAKGVMAAVAVLLVCSLCDPNTNINSIYEDLTIALMFSYSAFLVYQKEYRTKAGQFAYLMSLVALIGTKQIGIAFIGLSLLYLVLSVLFLEPDRKEKRKGLLCMLISAVAAGAYYVSWNRLVRLYPDERQFDLNNMSLSLFLKRITDSSDREHRDMLKRFIFELFDRNIASGLITITYFTSFFFFFLIIIALAYKFKEKFSGKEAMVLGTVFAVGEVGYALMMLMLYEMSFEQAEMTSMHSFARYMGSYFLAELMLLLLIALWILGRKNLINQKTGKMCVALMLALVLLVPGKLGFLVPQGILGDKWYDTRQRGAFITENVKEGSRIYLAYERTDGDREQVQYSYFVEGSRIDYTHYNLSADNLKNIDFKKLEETLRQDDYVYTLSVTEGINKAFTAYNGGKDLKDYTLYSVEDEGGKVVLKEIGR